MSLPSSPTHSMRYCTLTVLSLFARGPSKIYSHVLLNFHRASGKFVARQSIECIGTPVSSATVANSVSRQRLRTRQYYYYNAVLWLCRSLTTLYMSLSETSRSITHTAASQRCVNSTYRLVLSYLCFMTLTVHALYKTSVLAFTPSKEGNCFIAQSVTLSRDFVWSSASEFVFLRFNH